MHISRADMTALTLQSYLPTMTYSSGLGGGTLPTREDPKCKPDVLIAGLRLDKDEIKGILGPPLIVVLRRCSQPTD